MLTTFGTQEALHGRQSFGHDDNKDMDKNAITVPLDSHTVCSSRASTALGPPSRLLAWRAHNPFLPGDYKITAAQSAQRFRGLHLCLAALYAQVAWVLEEQISLH